MSDLLWPGDHRTTGLLDDAAVLTRLVAVEQAWLDALVAADVAPARASTSLAGQVTADDLADLAAAAESSGTPVLPLVTLLRERLSSGGHLEAARWLHRGLTSQDVLDTALMLAAQSTVAVLRDELAAQLALLADQACRHRDDVAVARTLGRPAVPTTLGLRIAHWMDGLLAADDALARLGFPAQLGGAAGTQAALTELVNARSRPAGSVDAVLADVAGRLGLAAAMPWQTVRSPVTRLADALVECCDAFGHIAHDVLLLSRPEIGELSEGSAGESSTMPGKDNPVLAVLVRRAALAAPALAGVLHTASAASQDERSEGPWHVEWAILQTLLRRVHAAAGQLTDLVAGLRWHPERAAAAVGERTLGEQRAVRATLGVGAGAQNRYLGAAADYVDQTLLRAERLRAGRTDQDGPGP